MTSTSETYGSALKIPMNEKHRLIGQSPYAASKIAADQLSISYWRSFKLPVKIIRPFNTYGPRQSDRAVIPSIILQALANRDIKLENITTSRDYTYVKDLCAAFLKVIKIRDLNGMPINVGSNKEIKIKDIARLIIKKVNPKLKVIIDKKKNQAKLSEVNRLKCDNSLLIDKTNWKPLITFEDGLEETIDWIRDNKMNNDYNN